MYGGMKKPKLILLFTLVLCSFFTCLAEASEIREISVNVKLNDDGSALVTQIWSASVDDRGTEFYIPISGATLGDMRLKNFTVHDESGREFINEGTSWDSSRSAAQKSGRCGIAVTDSGFELCWGLGAQGDRAYKVSWVYTNFVKAYSDYDGFNVRLVNDKISPSPEKVSVTVEKAGYKFKSGDVDMWAFGYVGSVLPVDGKVVAATESDYYWGESDYVNLMLRFKKGLFSPTSSVNDDFSSLVERAMEDTPGFSSIHKIDIHVKLNDDGSAEMLQTWDVHSHSDIARFSLLMERRDDVRLEDFSVSDENGAALIKSELDWRDNVTAAESRGQCGIAESEDSLKLCWGRGLVGDHTYRVSCRLTGFVRSFSDYDGADFVFIPEGLHPCPESIKLTVEKPGYRFKKGDLEFWTFTNTTAASIADGKIVVSITPPDKEWSQEDSLKLMLRFKKGLFKPTDRVDATFSSVIGKKVRSEYLKLALYIFAGILIIFLILKYTYVFIRWIIVSIYRGFKYGRDLYPKPLGTFTDKLSRRGERKFNKELKNARWSRAIPFDGDLRLINFAILSTPFAVTIKKSSLVEAYFLRFIKLGLLRVQENETGAKSTSLAVVNAEEVVKSLKKDERELFDMLSEAAGENNILESSEFKSWGRKSANRERIVEWQGSFEEYGKKIFKESGWAVETGHRRLRLLRKFFGSVSLSEDGMNSFKSVVGFRKYLLDFTLLNERRAVEVELWDDYLVLASLFNCAKAVSAEFIKLKPDFQTASEILRSSSSFDMAAVSSVADSFYRSSFERSSSGSSSGSSYSSSSGGSSYSGGGGGYSGGGSGGGIR